MSSCRCVIVLAFLAMACTRSIGVHATAAQATPYADRVRVQWSGSDARLSPDGSRLLGDKGEALASLKPNDDLYVTGKFKAGERLPDGSYVVENGPRPAMVAFLTTGTIVSAVLGTSSVAGLSIFCSNNSACTDPIAPEAALLSLALGVSIGLFIVSVVGLTHELFFRDPVIKSALH